MKLSFDWLSDFLDLSGLNAQEVADKLTMGAFEVEELRCVGPEIVGPLVVGEILEINPHPNADKIRLTKIKLAENAPAQEIVCGAWNIEVGHKIPVALPGAQVINRHDGTPLFIKESKIRGVTSNGMLCSAPELGLSGGGDGILILAPETKIGIDARDTLGIKTDYILHVEPRSNRGDALCVLGLAREVAALFNRPLKAQTWLEEFAELKINGDLPVLHPHLENQEDCPYFSLRTLAGIKIGPSNTLISRRLEAIGVKCINNIVDISNYVLHELGQPLHAYDLSKIQGENLYVRRAAAGESILTLDQKERSLNPETLIIADSKGAVGVAGVMGGKDSEVSDDTTIVSLEAACFAGARVRRSSRMLGLSSDSSLRFERGVDKAQVLQCSNRASYLAAKHYGAELSHLTCAGSDKVDKLKVQVRMSELKRICEIDMELDAAADLLEPLGFHSIMHADDYNQGVLNVEVPSFRQKDVHREIDLIEEICRLYGYDALPVSMPASTVAAQVRDELPLKVRQVMVSCGLSEAWISSLISMEDLEARGAVKDQSTSAVSVLNPLSAEHQVLRQSLIPGLLKAAAYNLDRANSNPCLFETGKVYRRSSKQFRGEQSKITGTEEEPTVAAVICGDPKLSRWTDSDNKSRNEETYYQVKGIAENLADAVGIPVTSLRFSRTAEIPAWFHPGRSAACYVDLKKLPQDASKKKGKNKDEAILLGFLGEVHPGIADLYRLSGRAALLEFSMDALSEARRPSGFTEIFNTPTSSRDLTVDLEQQVTHQEVMDCIYSCGDETLKEVELVSIFKLSETVKSLSYRLSFQHASETLKAEALDAILARMRQELTQKLKAGFRL